MARRGRTRIRRRGDPRHLPVTSQRDNQPHGGGNDQSAPPSAPPRRRSFPGRKDRRTASRTGLKGFGKNIYGTKHVCFERACFFVRLKSEVKRFRRKFEKFLRKNDTAHELWTDSCPQSYGNIRVRTEKTDELFRNLFSGGNRNEDQRDHSRAERGKDDREMP